ncbi:MAG: DUF2490 domain-containing protein [Candidatus Omnitrophica bacterium]|nr:DUF2490 domain-containing protein [Candidatus Omnitrophota bacterium]
MRRLYFLMLIAVLAVIKPAFAFDNHDFQVWNTDVEEMKLNKTSKLVFEQEFRLGNNASDFYYQHYDIGYVYDVNKHLNVGLGYRYIKEMQNKSFRVENEPYLVATLFWDLAGFKFDSRNRFEYRTYDYNKVDSGRYRNKITMKFPWKFTKIEIQPYLSDEIFVRFNGTDLNQNRAYAGLSFLITKNLRGEVYYMLQSTKNYISTGSTWTDANVLGTKLKLSF